VIASEFLAELEKADREVSGIDEDGVQYWVWIALGAHEGSTGSA
jgi:hypothetical protein